MSGIDGRRVLDFAQILERCYREQRVDEVKVTAGTYDVSRTVKVRREYGNTPLVVHFADGHYVRGIAREMTWMTTKASTQGFERVTSIRVGLDLQARTYKREDPTEAMLKRLSRNTNVSARRRLAGLHYCDIRHLYNRAAVIKHELKRKIAQANLRKHAKLVWGVSMTWAPVLRVETTRHGVVQAAVAASVALIRLVNGPLALKRDLEERMRAVRVKPKTVARELCNWRQECKNFSAKQEPE